MRDILYSAVAVITLLVTNLAIAENLYITDKFSIPVYADQSAHGSPIKMLASGAAVDVINKDENFARIMADNNVQGWIESKYLTTEKSYQLDYQQLAAKYKLAEEKIQDYQTRLLEMQELRKDAKTADWLRNRLNENEKNETSLQQQIKQKEITIADLKISYANLENELERLRHAQIQNSSSANQDQAATGDRDTSYYSTSSYSTSSSVNFYTWLILSLAVTLIIGILMGFVLIDYKDRKKPRLIKSY